MLCHDYRMAWYIITIVVFPLCYYCANTNKYSQIHMYVSLLQSWGFIKNEKTLAGTELC